MDEIEPGGFLWQFLEKYIKGIGSIYKGGRTNSGLYDPLFDWIDGLFFLHFTLKEGRNV
jgi:hypothetical protein